jgi:hypothetical protein
MMAQPIYGYGPSYGYYWPSYGYDDYDYGPAYGHAARTGAFGYLALASNLDMTPDA